MGLVIAKMVDLYFYLNDEISDPRVRNMLFMSNPFSMFAIIFLYLCFVLKWGPNLMKNRKPFNIERIIIIYNIVQIIACLDLVWLGFKHAYTFTNGYNILCEPVDYSHGKVALIAANGCHNYFLLKVLDLLDTVFFVLRKKDKQITFLHTYHHTGMVVLTWNATKFLAGGHSVFTGFLNSIVHIIMYSYYLVSVFNPKYKNNIWWKKYITQMQIVQFFIIILHWSALLFQPDCKFPKFTVAVMVPQNLFMLALFSDFYRKTYMQSAKREADAISITKDECNGDAHGLYEELPNGWSTINDDKSAQYKLRKGLQTNNNINGNFLKDIHYT